MPAEIYFFDLLGTFTFAAYGAYIGQRKLFDIFGIFICAFLTATGGGTIRELILGNVLFYFFDYNYFYAIILGTIFSICAYKMFDKINRYMLVVDAVGLTICPDRGDKGRRGGAGGGCNHIPGYHYGGRRRIAQRRVNKGGAPGILPRFLRIPGNTPWRHVFDFHRLYGQNNLCLRIDYVYLPAAFGGDSFQDRPVGATERQAKRPCAAG